MHRYHFSLGDSNVGPVGYCAAVYAESHDDALRMLKDMIPDLSGEARGWMFFSEPNAERAGGVDYVDVYFNADALTIRDIDFVENN
jgi:hypothetical protein